MGIVDRSGEDRDPPRAHDPIDDVNPLDLPDEEQLAYDLSAWPVDVQAAAAEALAEAGISHAWNDTELTVHVRHEAEADQILEQLELDAGIAPAPTGDETGATADAETVDTSNGDVEYELDAWSPESLSILTDHLRATGVGFRWESDTLLVVSATDEQAVEEALDDIEDRLGGAAGAEAGEEPVTPDDLFVAVERLGSRPDDREAILGLNAVLERAEAAGPPFGFEQRTWDEVLDDVSDLLDTALDADDAHDVRSEAENLLERLRPLV